MTIFPRILDLLRGRGAGRVLLTGGGIIPEPDARALEKMGVGRLFGPGTPLAELAAYIRTEVAARRAAGGMGRPRDPA
jgi:methylmalonyl-CoA mutase C-terminal domain/subunit